MGEVLGTEIGKNQYVIVINIHQNASTLPV